jgi:drug/metabolite transporter (DMT)-like permease
VLFGLMSVIWGVPYLLIKVADGGVSVPVLVFARVAIGSAVLLPLAIRRGQIRVLAARWRWLALFAVVEIMLPWALLSDAERRLSSSLTGLLIAAVPIIGLVLARLTGGPEQLTAVRWAGLLAGLGGVALLAGPHLAGGGAWPIAEVILVALCYATGPLIANRKLGDLPGLGMTAVCLAAAALVYAAPAALTWPSRLPSAAVLASLAGLGVLCTALAFVLFFQLIAEAGPARATVITYVNPAVAVALGVGVLGEPLTPAIVAAFVLILSGSVLATRSGVPRPRPAPGPRLPAPGPRRPAPDLPRPAPDLPRPAPDLSPRQLRSADRPALPD